VRENESVREDERAKEDESTYIGRYMHTIELEVLNNEIKI
jgi:hypothetical protein